MSENEKDELLTAIMGADHEFLHGVPVNTNERGAESVIKAIEDAGFIISKRKKG